MEQLTTLDRAIRLQKVELFSDLETDMLALLASIAHQIEVRAGETIVDEGAQMGSLYVVLDGNIEMRRGGLTIYNVGTDETLGNWALFDRQPSVVTAVAAEDSWLLKIDREDFFDLLADHSEITREIFQALFKRARMLLSAGLERPESGAAPTT